LYQCPIKGYIHNFSGISNENIDPTVQTDRNRNKKPDSTVRDDGTEMCVLMDVAVPGDKNVMKKETESYWVKLNVKVKFGL
jgi:hypothetical protein